MRCPIPNRCSPDPSTIHPLLYSSTTVFNRALLSSLWLPEHTTAVGLRLSELTSGPAETTKYKALHGPQAKMEIGYPKIQRISKGLLYDACKPTHPGSLRPCSLYLIHCHRILLREHSLSLGIAIGLVSSSHVRYRSPMRWLPRST